MTTADDLRSARKLIERPECWTKETHARGATGYHVSAASESAVCWCAEGALMAVVSSVKAREAGMRALGRSLGKLYGVVAFNDAPTTTHAMILALFDRAIAAAESESAGQRGEG